MSENNIHQLNMQLQIRHIGTLPEGKAEFQVVRMHDGKLSPAVTLISPWEISNEINGKKNLRSDLQWYLEEYLGLPIGAFNEQAEMVVKALFQWGKECFTALFNNGGQAQDWYNNARQNKLSNLRITIASDDPAVLSWPWEVLESKYDGFLAQQCQINRQLNDIGNVCPMPNLPKNKLNILYIIARPNGENDVGFQTLARPLIEFVTEKGWPVNIDVLRPPTFNQLRKTLEEKTYHIVHFDGHGGFASSPVEDRSGFTTIREPTGKLVFENDECGEDIIQANVLGELLRQYNIPVMVLNACQSAMLDKDAFASVAVSLLNAGVRSVVAMSYSLFVSGAKVFVPAFYQQLFKAGNIATAMQAGRQEMFRDKMRVCSYGQIEFNDWFVPVLYQHENLSFPKLKDGNILKSVLPSEMQDLGDGFIGRDISILELERALQRKPAGILIHGMAGEGKTTLVKGFFQWLERTNGLGMDTFWFSFENIQSAEYIINKLAGKLFCGDAMSLTMEEKMPAIIYTLKTEPFFLIWDNFESASGIPDTEVSALLPEADRKLLKQFLHELKGGKTKIFITSRSSEDWLPASDCYRLRLGGLKGEELWQYCNAVVSDLGLSLDRKNTTYKYILDKLEGNPLAIRAVLLQLQKKSAETLLVEFEEDLLELKNDENMQHIQVALSVFERGLDKNFAPILRLLGLHEHFADTNYISRMIKAIGKDAPIDKCFTALEKAGLCHHIENHTFQLHPALRSFLIRLHPSKEKEQKVFVNVISALADEYEPKELHIQRHVFDRFSANFYRALQFAKEMDMRESVLMLTQALGTYAKNIYNLSEAERMYTKLAKAAKGYNKTDWESKAYFQLGKISLEERHNLDVAENWYQKSLSINLKLCNEKETAIIYRELSEIAEAKGNSDVAKDLYNKAESIFPKDNTEQIDELALNTIPEHYCERGKSLVYGILGLIAKEKGDFDTAKSWFKQASTILLKQGYEHDAAINYQELGDIELEQGDFTASENWYKKSLDIMLKLCNEYDVANIYLRLGKIALEQKNFATAESWLKRYLAINQKQYNEKDIAITYLQLGVLAKKLKYFAAAEYWFMQSSDNFMKQGKEHGVAYTYHMLGSIAQEQQDFETAEEWHKKASDICEQIPCDETDCLFRSSLKKH